uniref:Uncharacterized protein MANES_07G140200 n=1 Tax=Rhizophora mucronata TaxID=61149 RepID=A0A2P2MG29_RHIMU
MRMDLHCHALLQVYPLGSVPLKTYLPDGDIDLTAFTFKNMEEDLARDVCYILKAAEQDPQFQVKNVQYIQAKVKIVKFSIKNISVDISFNQIGGICALCFLEQVDQLAGGDHLLKRSIILIKAWCLYESRILGAYHGLISTYTLVIMIVHIINLFHSSLPGPLAVLWRFLDYYSTFDWDNYCVSINGPVAISSLPVIAAGSLKNTGNCLLLSQEFWQNFRECFSVQIKAPKNTGLQFPVKHLNIMDPLKEGNNLGHSVSRANFHRIRRAFSHGAQCLREILMLPAESMGAGLEKFFVNTLDRNGRGERPDVPVPVPAFGTGRSEVSDLCGDYSSYSTALLCGQWYLNHPPAVPLQPSTSSLVSQFQQKGSTGVPFELTRCRQHTSSTRSKDVFVPGRPPYHLYTWPPCYLYPQPLCHLYTWPPSAAPSGFDRMGRPRVTDSVSPQTKIVDNVD